MSRVFHQCYYHLVWSTKEREPVLSEAIRQELPQLIRARCKELGCVLHAVGAVEDHVHVALEIPLSEPVATVVGKLKGGSSHDLNERRVDSIYWQRGYGIVTFRQGDLRKVMEYISTQEERHRSGTVSEMLERSEVAEE